MQIYDEIIQDTQLEIFYKICENKSTTETLKEYLNRQVSPPSITTFKKPFNAGQLKQIDSNPLCDKYDTSLFAACLPLIAEYNPTLSGNQAVVDQLKAHFKKLKDIRNDLAHNLLSLPETTVENHANDLKSCMNDLLDLVGTTFGCRPGTDSRKRIVQDGIDGIMSAPQMDYDNRLVHIFGSLLIIFGFLLVVSLIINFRYFMRYG